MGYYSEHRQHGAYSSAPVRVARIAQRLMDEDELKVLEYNVRFDDPECQVLCARMKSDLL